MRVKWGSNGVKPYFSSDLNETWIVGTFLGHNKVGMPNFVIGGLLVPILTPSGVRGSMGSNLSFHSI